VGCNRHSTDNGAFIVVWRGNKMLHSVVFINAGIHVGEMTGMLELFGLGDCFQTLEFGVDIR